MPVLYGVLMFMGVNTLRGMQFIDRCMLFLMPSKHQPDTMYLRHVPLRKIHLFTAIQVATLAALWIIKSTPASLIFPLMVLALVGFRKKKKNLKKQVTDEGTKEEYETLKTNDC